MTRDPVCGMQVDERTAQGKTNYQGREYQFCSQDCKSKFDEHPERYAQQQQQQRSGGGAA